MGNPVSCSEGLGCDGICGSDEGPGTSGYLDECNVCGGNGKLAGWSSCFFEQSMNYSTDIQPIFTAHCTGCHGDSNGLTLTSHDDVMMGTSINGPVIIATDYKNSLLWKYINDGFMPYNLSTLTSAQIDSVAAWIQEGAIDN